MPTITRPARRAQPGGVKDKFTQYQTLVVEADALAKRAAKLKAELSGVVDNNGEPDERGSLFLNFPEPITIGDKTFTALKRERRVSTSFLTDEAEAWLAKHGLLERCQKTIVVLDQDEVYLLNQETADDGKPLLPSDVLDSFFEENITWAFKPIA